MFQYLIIREQRLTGTLPFVPGALITCNTNASTTTNQIFSRVNTATALNGGKLNTIFILCHGYAGSNNNVGMSMDAGGMGLQLGKDDLKHNNVDKWTAIKNKTENIVVYSCAAANTERGNEGSNADGKYLMGALAIYTNANVYAADRIQWYGPTNYNFGSWEGDLYRFSADGSPANRIARPPIELSEIL